MNATTKGLITKESILTTAFELASKVGFEALSIGELAKAVGMSKSGLFGHFNSKEKLQMMVMDYAAHQFAQVVIIPAIKEPRGIPRLNAMTDNYIEWARTHSAGGCPILAAAIEYDDRPGKVRDKTKKFQTQMLSSFERAAEICVEEGQFRKDLDPKQFAFEYYGLILSFHIYEKLLGDKQSEKLLKTSIDELFQRTKG